MSDSSSCRLCLSANSDSHLDIFSDIGIEMKICEIISQHFNCEVNVTDSLPNFVCQLCWTVTKSFHKLYQKSKVVQEKLLNPLIKIEPDSHEIWSNNENKGEIHYIEETNLEIAPIKVEPNLDSDSNNSDQIDYDEASIDSDENTNEVIDNYDPEFEGNEENQNNIRKRRRTRPKVMAKQFATLFIENKYRFDLSCDFCPTTFDSLDEARKHYAEVHKNPKGYIKCCGSKLLYPCLIVQHLQRHIHPHKFKCTECPKAYCNEFGLRKHMKWHAEGTNRKEKTLSCKICSKLFARNSSLENHMKWHEERDELEDGQFVKFIAENFDMKCDHCDTMFTGFYDARRHYKEFHNEEKGYLKCCNTKLREPVLVRDHIRSHLDPECFKCDVCDKSCSTRVNLVQHKRHHKLTREKRFSCDYCGKAFRNKNTLTKHMFARHVNAELKFECEICHKKFKLPSLLKSHIYGVHREKKRTVTCEICGKSFYVKFHLDKHMLSHVDKSERLTQGKKCEYCGEWLMTKSGIYYHEQIHTSGIQKCQHCDMELPNKVALLGHIRQYHREHKFKCSFCDKTFSTASTMKTHEESHTRHKNYQCKFCPRVFCVQSSRRTHTRRNHHEELQQSKTMKFKPL